MAEKHGEKQTGGETSRPCGRQKTPLQGPLLSSNGALSRGRPTRTLQREIRVLSRGSASLSIRRIDPSRPLRERSPSAVSSRLGAQTEQRAFV
ncbi:hypothetical protein SKAU_G00003550 [Synaphobranchus kaupii]|uniref:Uncharacterized protein n=1 Tax=Synaphobranchus kaupii TaxID=118154 RepID=A0A9Q1GAC1_SYNKA|nr:hypothetical protein SKAU_G00003550 [Synaphobranchus kaupii]